MTRISAERPRHWRCWLRVAALSLLAALAGCGDTAADDVSDPTGITTSVEDLSGDWRGVLVDGRELYALTLSLAAGGTADSLTGSIVVEPNITRAARRFPTNDPVTVAGEWSAPLGTLTLQTQSGHPRGEVIIDVAVVDGGALAVLAERNKRGGYGNAVGRAYLSRSSDISLDRALELKAGLHRFRPTSIHGDCPEALRDWLAAAIAHRATGPKGDEVYAPLYNDEFERAFGAPYDRVDVETLKQNAGLIRGACRPEDRRDASTADRMVHLVAGRDTHHPHLIRRFGLPVAEAWAAGRAVTVASDMPMSSTEIDRLQALWRRLGLASYRLSLSDLDDDIKTRRAVLAEAEAREQLLAMYDNYAERFDLLVLLVQRHRDKDEVFRAAASERVARYFESAAEAYIDNAKHAEDARWMLAWSQGIERGAECPVANARDCQRVAARFDDRVEELSREFAKQLDEQWRREAQSERTAAALTEHVKYAQTVERTYGDLLAVDRLEDVWESITDARRSLQARLRDTLRDELETLTSAGALTAFEKRYFAMGDLDVRRMRPIASELNDRLSQHAPFRQYRGGDYLNALANRDAGELRTLDQYYMKGYQAIFELGAQAMALMTPEWSNDVRTQAASLSAVYAVFATYLLDYETRYPQCLGPNAVEFQITRGTETITREFGREVSRVTNWTTRNSYRVPVRLEAAFKAVWRADPRTSDVQFMDWLANDLRTRQLIGAVETAMADYACDSPEITKLERGLVWYHQRVAR